MRPPPEAPVGPAGCGRFAAAATTVLVALACALPWALEPAVVNHDVGWYAYAAGQVLDGARPYVDVVDVNPPLVLYLTAVPVALGRALGGSPVVSVHAAVVVLAWASLALTAWLLRRARVLPGPWSRALALWGVAYALLLLPGGDFAQREHLLLVLALPYAVLAALRGTPGGVERAPTPLAALAIGAAAGLGLALKPHFLLGPLCLLGVRCARHRKLGALRTPENAGICVVLAVYALHFALLPADVRDGLRATLDLALATYGGYRAELATWLGKPVFWCALALPALAALPLPAGGPDTRGAGALRRGLGLQALGLLAATLLQGKGWAYHFLPAITLGGLGLWTSVAATLATLARNRPRPARGLGPAVAVGCILFLAHGVRAERAARAAEGPTLAAGDQLRELARGRSVLGLSTGLKPHFPTVTYAGVHWALRYCTLWPLPGLYPASAEGAPLYRSLEQRGAFEREVADAVLADLHRWQPVLVMVERPPLPRMPRPDFDVLEWLLVDPAFARHWERSYRRARAVRGMDVYVRRPTADASPGDGG